MILIDIKNVVARAKISGWDRDMILEKMSHAEYRPNGFPATYVTQGNATISLFNSGKTTSMGSKSEKYALQSILEFCDSLKSYGMKILVDEKPVISLIVSNVSFEKKINLTSLRKSSYFQKDIKRFHRIQLVFFEGTVNVMAYEWYCVVKSRTLTDIIKVAKILQKYTRS